MLYNIFIFSSTGMKFFVVAEPGTQIMESLLKYIYELYTDYVLKNPFYEMEMPIRCELFDINLSKGPCCVAWTMNTLSCSLNTLVWLYRCMITVLCIFFWDNIVSYVFVRISVTLVLDLSECWMQ